MFSIGGIKKSNTQKFDFFFSCFQDSASALSALQVLSVVLVILVGPAIQIADLISVFNDTMSTYWIKVD